MRPRSLDEVVGQQHLLAPGAPLRRLVEGGAPTSVLLYGPPGTGKTTLAHALSPARPEPALRRSCPRCRPGSRRCARSSTTRGAGCDRRPADRAVHRRGAPVLQDPAGLAARRGRGPARHCWSPRPPRTRSSRWSRRCCPARCVLHAAAADRRRRPRPLLDRAVTDERGPGRRGHARRRRREDAPGPAGRRRRPPGADRAGGGARTAARPRAGEHRRSTWRRWSAPSTEAAVRYDRARATSTTTSSARSSSRSAAATSTRRCTTWPG